ncbi:MAG: c-type cytochrome [Planctomycetaceae bacterium]|nr:c-type cytochrome [Planctomycetaceae bacterium]
MRRNMLVAILGLAALTAMGRLHADDPSSQSDAAATEDLGLAVVPGFEVTRFAGDDLCHDVFSMTFDSQGRVVVSGPGYVRILIDSDNDGRADEAREFTTTLASGAQGMYFHGRDLLCTGDAGLLRFKDRDGDDHADGPAETFLRAKAGSEHDIHAIRRGADGWWYLIAGNTAGIDKRYVTLPTSPVKEPKAGTVIRFKPDLTGGEAIADGLRNAYDFDFTTQGQLLTFDSDGERDLSLPWYQPSRVFHVLTGANHGWHSNSHIQPSDDFDMPPTVAEFGRSSPTGVVCYRHSTFPEQYQGAMFLLDWTFGRMWALPLREFGGTVTGEPIEFLTAEGDHGFAPTDAEVGPDGCLYLCIGGRGTRGGVFRIQPTGASPRNWSPNPTTPTETLNACLQSPQPMSSWSRAKWEPWAAQLQAVPFIRAAQDVTRPVNERLRAIEILTEKFEGLPQQSIQLLAADKNPAVRARVAWSIGRLQPGDPVATQLKPFMADPHPVVALAALEAVLGADPAALPAYATELGNQLAHPDGAVRQTAFRVLAKVTTETYQQAAAVAINHGWQGAVPVARAYAIRHPGFQSYPLEIGIRLLRSPTQSLDLKADAARLVVIALGDLGLPSEETPVAFESYSSQVDLTPHDQELDLLRILVAKMYPTGHAHLDRELERITAMIRPANDQLLAKILEKITPESNPVDDLHRLIVVSRIQVTPRSEPRKIIADAITRMELKIAEQGLHLDNSWVDRVREVYAALVEQDRQLPVAVLEHPDFGLPGHVQFVSEMPPERFDDVLTTFLKKIETEADYPWNSDVVFLLAASEEPDVRELIRTKFEEYSLRAAVVMSLAELPEEQDRSFFVRGLESSGIETLLECIKALAVLRPSEDATENVMLVRTLRRLGIEGEERQARDQVAEILRRNLKISFDYQLAQDGDPQQKVIDQWTEAVRNKFPYEYARQMGESTEDIAKLYNVLNDVAWVAGDAHRGEALFRQRACAQCHGGRQALGPDLTGVTGRFSKEDLFTAIAFPHRDVSPRYQTTQIATTQGHVYTGLIVYEYADALVLRDAQNQSHRIDTKDIEARKVLNKSLMPTGLLKDLETSDYADLYSYLRGLNVRVATREE